MLSGRRTVFLRKSRLNRLTSLAAVSNDWLDAASPIRAEAVSALQVSTGYSQRLVEQALDAVFEALTLEKMKAYVDSLTVPATPVVSLTILHIAAGNVFTAWLHGAVISLLLGHRVWVKPSSNEPVFIALWKKSVARRDAALAESIRIVTWGEELAHQVDVAVAYGSDETLKMLRKTFSGRPFVGYGHKLSVAIVFRGSGDIDAAVRDIEAFDLEGCLSPQIFYVERDGTVLAQAIKKRLPNSRMPRWKSFDSLSMVWNELASLQPHLSCVGMAGSAVQQQLIETHFENAPDIRLCPLGEMQSPPLAWRNGGVHLGEFLLKCSRAHSSIG